MVADPLVALLLLALAVVAAALLFWPRRGLAPRLTRLLRMTERVRIEDALKHLYDCEYSGKSASIDSVAGALEMSRARATRLVVQLEAMRLIHSDGVGLPLTEAGRGYALRLLRTHRLWERYLADRTNVSPTEWHEQAERAEHVLQPAQTEKLAAQMGYPLYDPHGDPIPTVNGDMPPREGVALTSLQPGEVATVVHLEDEPTEVFQQIVNAGLTPLMKIELKEATPEAVRFCADGQERELPPVAASNVTVVPVQPTEEDRVSVSHLSDLDIGEVATVSQIAPACQGLQRRRLLDLGFVPGTVVSAELSGALGDPVGYRVRGALVALRREQAEWIHVQRGTSNKPD